jgi:hypothetical protein
MPQQEQHWFCREALSATPDMKKVGSLPKHFAGRAARYQARRSEHPSDNSFNEWRDRHVHRVIGRDHFPHAYVRYSSDGTFEGTLYEVWGWEPQWGPPPDAVGAPSPGAPKKKPAPNKKGKGNK